MPRLFTIEQAERLLPELEPNVRLAVSLKSSWQAAQQDFDAETRRIAMAGGSVVNREKLLALRSRLDATARRLDEVIKEIQEHGCLVKDLDLGLIDFPTLYRGEEVLLCWKLGEPAITHWHGLNEGYRGRKPILREKGSA